MRYFARIAYRGTNYCGWQRQPPQPSVQETIEKALSTILRQEIAITGCGRTDTGVHASEYYIHFDFEGDFPKGFLSRLNKYLPSDIVFYEIIPLDHPGHARFDATNRSYAYYLGKHKDPFNTETVYHFPFMEQLDADLLNEAAKLLLNYESFFPFCKTKSDVKTMDCQLTVSHWEWNAAQEQWIYHISANRFLRGMVRLIVGMCLNVAMRKLRLEEVQKALEEQSRLRKSWSVPPNGLFLTEIKYPFISAHKPSSELKIEN